MKKSNLSIFILNERIIDFILLWENKCCLDYELLNKNMEYISPEITECYDN